MCFVGFNLVTVVTLLKVFHVVLHLCLHLSTNKVHQLTFLFVLLCVIKPLNKGEARTFVHPSRAEDGDEGGTYSLT